MPKGVKILNNGTQRCSQAVKAERIEEGGRWILDHPNHRWIDFMNFAEAAWNVQHHQAKKYLKMCNEHIGNIEIEGLEAKRKKAENSLARMFLNALEKNDTKLALQIKQELNKISGLYTQKIEVQDVTELPIFGQSPIKASEEDEMK